MQPMAVGESGIHERDSEIDTAPGGLDVQL
jgi:hypothetical protein